MRGVFDIIGPIMIGPSSSHTAGAVRLGNITSKILGEEAITAIIDLHGSFAETYKGHGTDKALIAGIMGFKTSDERIKDALKIAQNRDLVYRFNKVNLGGVHPNTVVFHLTGQSGRTVEVTGASVGGGNILITNIDGYGVELTGQYPTLITIHHDQPGIITKVTSVLAKYRINVAFMRVSRKRRGAEALMIIEVDDALSSDVIEEIKRVGGVTTAFDIPPI